MAYTLAHNTPVDGCIQWTGLRIQFRGSTYAVQDGYTNQIYCYWLATNPYFLTVSDSYPELTADDCLIFLNKSGVGLAVPDTSILDGGLIVPGSIMADAIAANTITGDKLVAGTITGNEIRAGAIGAATIAAAAVNVSHLNTNVGVEIDLTANASLGGLRSDVSSLNGSQTSLTQTVTGLGVTVSGVQQTLADAASETSALADRVAATEAGVGTLNTTLSTFFDFDADGLTIRKSDSAFKTVLSNTKLAFVEGANEVAYISSNKMYIASAELGRMFLGTGANRWEMVASAAGLVIRRAT